MTEENNVHFDRFYKIIDEMIALFNQLISFENKKMDAIRSNEIELLENYMHEEQAYLLKLRGLDQKREGILAQLGFADKTFSEIIVAAPEAHKLLLEEKKNLLSEKTTELQTAVESTKRFIEVHIHSLDNLMQRIEKENKVYDKNGTKVTKDSIARFKPTKA